MIAVYGAVWVPSCRAKEPPKRSPRRRPSITPPGRHSAMRSTSVTPARTRDAGTGTVKERVTRMWAQVSRVAPAGDD
jgi:hypothetical protein